MKCKQAFAEIHPVCDNRFIALEGISFGNVITEEYFFFRMRFIRGINREMRIKFHDRIFEIKRIVDEHEREKILSIVALEISDNESEDHIES
ncbi:head-tail adaptor protein [Rickettsiaceae bacterium]|nr:head-tail adaptor protein [Rickettsiaceae bacterium]